MSSRPTPAIAWNPQRRVIGVGLALLALFSPVFPVAAQKAAVQSDRLAATPLNPLHDTILRSLGLILAQGAAGTSGGATIAEVASSSDAARKGIKAGDVILNVGADPVSTPEEVVTMVEQIMDHGRRTVMLRLKSGDKERFVTVRMENVDTVPPATALKTETADRSAAQKASDVAAPATGPIPWLGVGMLNLNENDAARLRLTTTKGVLVTGTSPDGPAAAAGLQKDDVIVAFDTAEIVNRDALAMKIASSRAGSTLTLRVLRNGEMRDIKVMLGSRSADDPLALLQSVKGLYETGKYDQAETLWKRAFPLLEQILGPDHPVAIKWLGILAHLSFVHGRHVETEQLIKRQLVIYEKKDGPESPAVADLLHRLGVVNLKQGQPHEAELLLKHALGIIEKVKGPEDRETASRLFALGRTYEELQRYAEAEPLFQRALAIREKVDGADARETGIALQALARLYSAQGRASEAEPLYRRAVAIADKVSGRVQVASTTPKAPSDAAVRLSVITDAARKSEQDMSCTTVTQVHRNGENLRICSGGGTREFAVTLGDGSAAWCEGREFAVAPTGALRNCKLSRPLIRVTAGGVERCLGLITVTPAGDVSKCENAGR